MLTPVGKKLMVEITKVENKLGLVLPSESKKGKKVECGKVITVGNACIGKFMAGMTVYFDHFAGTEIKMDGSTYLMLSEEDICAIAD